jgi:hypothetical protein
MHYPIHVSKWPLTVKLPLLAIVAARVTLPINAMVAYPCDILTDGAVGSDPYVRLGYTAPLELFIVLCVWATVFAKIPSSAPARVHHVNFPTHFGDFKGISSLI